jgi:hypothetical protein
MFAPPELLWRAVELCMERAFAKNGQTATEAPPPKVAYTHVGLDEDTFNGNVGLEDVKKDLNVTLDGVGSPRSVTNSDGFDVILDDAMDEVITAVGVSTAAVTSSELDTHPRNR